MPQCPALTWPNVAEARDGGASDDQRQPDCLLHDAISDAEAVEVSQGAIGPPGVGPGQIRERESSSAWRQR